MRLSHLFLIMLWSLALPAWAVDIAGTVNTYVKGSGDVAEGATTINYAGSLRGASTSINTGDLLLLIQSQGAVIDSTNTDAYGDGVGSGADISTISTSLHGTPGYAGGVISQTAGTFEYATVASVAGSQITLSEGLRHAYSDTDEANWQIIVVPDYGSSGARLTANIIPESWDGDTGGVVAFNATGGTIDFNGFTVNAAGAGFRGGVDGDINKSTGNIANMVYTTGDVDGLGGKGEGIAGTPRHVYDGSAVIDETVSTLAGGDYGRGAPGNAGGGAGPHNSGGGGGSNAGFGGSGAKGWVGGAVLHYPGYGGQSIFAGANMGGGGGSGDANDGGVAYGGLGGGVIILRADTGIGSGTLNVSGADAPDTQLTSPSGSGDGAGGGGAGGTVIVYFSTSCSLSGLSIDASGGMGGDASPEHGGGGGGGAGLVVVKNATVGVVDVSGGLKGANEGVDGVLGKSGGAGIVNTGAGAFMRLNTDYGDAPDTYGTISGALGAYHYFADYDLNGVLGAMEQLRLGANLDGEGGGNPGSNADSDDSRGLDDEDGVTGLAQVDQQGSTYTISASNISVTNTLGRTATLHAWIDFDQNGTFDSDEYSSISIAGGLTEQNPASDLTWTAMPGIDTATLGSTTYLRLRLSTDSSLDASSATGEAANGEVEDYAITVYDAPPAPLNVTRFNPASNFTNANQLVFAVTFSENVQNVDIADFSASGAGATAASVSAVSGSGSSYMVTVDVADTDGQVNLHIATTTGIQDLSGNNLGTITPSGSVETYTLDNTAPIISLQGASLIDVTLGDSYSDEGATANDNVDGNLTSSIVTSGAVNTAAPGTYTISYNVSDAVGNAATQVTRTVTVTIGPVAASTSLITASPTAITADGSSTSTITVQLKDSAGNNLTSGGDTVALSTTAGSLGPVTDNGNGTYTATLISSVTVGTATISGTVNAASITDTESVAFTVGAAAVGTSLITASPSVITADGISTSTITVQLKDVNGNNLIVGGETVDLSTTAGSLSAITDNGNGTYSATLTSSTSIETATITATLNSSPITNTGNVNFTVSAASGSTSLISASPGSIIADGISSSTITVQLKDSNGNNLSAGGDVVVLTTNAGSLSAVIDNGDGTYSATLTSGTSMTTASITGSVNSASITDTESVSFTPDLSADEDGDGIPNGDEGSGDFDGDGILDMLDQDSDNDGIPDAIEGSTDSDADGSPDYLDLDSDNDGLYDLIESGADYATLDTLNDGSIDVTNTVGTNGLADAVETTADSGVLSYNAGSPLDSDADGVEDYVDLDSDNDALTDVYEAGGVDPDGDGIVGVGAPTVDTFGVATAGSALTPIDNDDDGVNDQIDLDSDNDGIMDVVEFGGDDADGDGQVGSAPAQVDSKGLYQNGGLPAIDTDGDGVPNQHDLDSDNDGIPDVTEAGGSDPDGDGTAGSGATAVNEQGVDIILNPGDIDSDSILDPYDPDSDGDGIFDLVEAGGPDTDNNGLVDGFTDTNGDGFDDAITMQALPLPDSDADGIADFRDTDDSDNDGIADTIDIDDDNDGIPDALEGDGSIDSDGDGIPDSQDLDSDNDGLYDLSEAGFESPSSMDSDNDGRIDSGEDVGSNGLADALETSADSGSISYSNGTLLDTDADGVKDFRDLDSDNDSIPDVIEAGGDDENGDGVLGVGSLPVNSNGLKIGVGQGPVDTDGDGTPDQQDLDSDNDGIPDLQEAGGPDSDANGVVDSFIDTNGDGFDDISASSPVVLPDTDRNGTPDYRDAAAETGVVAVALDGIGAFNLWMLALLGLLAGLRQLRGVFVGALSVLMLLIVPG